MICLLENVTPETLLLICLFLPTFLDNVLNGIICLVNNDAMFTLDDVNIEEFSFYPLLEGIFKDSIKLFDQSCKENTVLCCHEYIICLKYKKMFTCFVKS